MVAFILRTPGSWTHPGILPVGRTRTAMIMPSWLCAFPMDIRALSPRHSLPVKPSARCRRPRVLRRLHSALLSMGGIVGIQFDGCLNGWQPVDLQHRLRWVALLQFFDNRFGPGGFADSR